jgi:hypothetical protein
VPLTWLITAATVFYFSVWELALLSLPVSALCGYAALYTQEVLTELGGWARAIRLFLTRRETFLRMFVERRELQHVLREFD